MALFAVLLGLSRIAYGKFGKSITTVLFVGMTGATVCYITVALTKNAVHAFIADAVSVSDIAAKYAPPSDLPLRR